ncbi:MAG: RluA family pseudouridine synthase [Calditrichota bacterium]
MIKSIPFRDPDGRKRHLDPIYEDEHLLVINKASGLPVLPDRWDPNLPNVRDLITRARLQENPSLEHPIWIVHRIDASTSGILLLAKTANMHRELNQMFAEAQIEKNYLCIVQGAPPADTGTVTLSLEKTPSAKRPVRISHQGRPAETTWKIIERFKRFALVEASPKTGRMHQIRVHMQSLGCPLAFDPLYGQRQPITIADFKRNARSTIKTDRPSAALIDRLTLHAARLSFTDPLGGIEHSFEAAIPKDLAALLKTLRKWDLP